MRASKIYDILIENKEKPDQPEAYFDRDTNTVWILLGHGRMLTFWCPDNLEEMTVEQIDEFVKDILSE